MKDRAYQIAKSRKYDGYQRALASMLHKFFDKKTGSGISVNEQLAEELHKPVKNLKEKNLKTRLKDKIWAADSAKMESLSSENRSVKYVLCVIDAFTEYAWFKP